VIDRRSIRWSRPPTNREEAAERAVRLFVLRSAEPPDSGEWAALVQRLRQSIERSDYQDLLRDRVDYALRLTEPVGELVYEEVHKLFSLREQIEALGALFPEGVDRSDVARLDDRIRSALAHNAKAARLVAEDRDDEFWRGFWWYQLARAGSP
jgi:hypothetical protein